MIATLHIKNIGIIEDLTVDFNNGFNVLTGETGAGKTLIIDSLNLVCGGRFSKEIIRHGENFCLVEINLFLPNYIFADIFEANYNCGSIVEKNNVNENNNKRDKIEKNNANENILDRNIIVSREVFLNGRNTCKINGRLVTVNELKDFMEKIIDIHGQNDNQTIMQKQEHISYLDNFIGGEIIKEKNKYQKLYNRYNEIKKELKENYGDEKEKRRRLDLLKYQFNEIDTANLKVDEEDELEADRKKMMNSEKIYSCLNEVDVLLSQNTVDSISCAIRALEKIEDMDEEYKNKLCSLKNIYYDVQELARDISSLNNVEFFDEEKRNEVEERLDYICDLKRKYGNSIEEIIQYKKQVENEIYVIENLDEYNNKLKAELEIIENKMRDIAINLNKIREKKSIELSEKINEELVDLEMKNAKFLVSIVKDEENFNSNGFDYIEFLISTNVGDESKPLIKIASGGEISRIMLAIKTVLADVDKVPILIFDEIDTGISGQAVKSVGEKVKIISKTHQVLCITHQANIAARGDANYYISKRVENERTYTHIKKLNEDEIIQEIARISSGDITKNAINHAKEMRYML